MGTAQMAWLWLILAVLMGVAELLAPGVFLIFLAIAAAATGLGAMVMPGLTLLGQLVSFALWSLVTIVIGKRWYSDYPVATADPLLNDRAARLIGKVVTVSAAIEHGQGRVRLGDSDWIAIGPDMPSGTSARIVALEATTIKVEPLPPPLPGDPTRA
jgi:membrane protein implicated in regulation of membrane protease activity